MYTRSQLMASLAEQKEHTSRLVGKVDELAGGLGDMEVRTQLYLLPCELLLLRGSFPGNISLLDAGFKRCRATHQVWSKNLRHSITVAL